VEALGVEEGAGGVAGVEEGVPAAGSLDLGFSLDSAGLDSLEDSEEDSELLEA